MKMSFHQILEQKKKNFMFWCEIVKGFESGGTIINTMEGSSIYEFREHFLTYLGVYKELDYQDLYNIITNDFRFAVFVANNCPPKIRRKFFRKTLDAKRETG